MDEQRKANIDADLVPAYQYRVFVCQPLDKDIEQVYLLWKERKWYPNQQENSNGYKRKSKWTKERS